VRLFFNIIQIFWQIGQIGRINFSIHFVTAVHCASLSKKVFAFFPQKTKHFMHLILSLEYMFEFERDFKKGLTKSWMKENDRLFMKDDLDFSS
jgi:hypothetical protein